MLVMRKKSSWTLSGELPPPLDTPGWCLRRERPLQGGYHPPDPPDWHLQRAGGASRGGAGG
eukprot:10425969-Alexandrium_andersonii.AAC.1